jgi:hypothetical protein
LEPYLDQNYHIYQDKYVFVDQLGWTEAWATDKMEAAETESDADLVWPGLSTPTPRKSHVEPPGRLSGDMRKHVFVKAVKSEHGMNKYLTRQCHVCAVHKRRRDTR